MSEAWHADLVRLFQRQVARQARFASIAAIDPQETVDQPDRAVADAELCARHFACVRVALQPFLLAAVAMTVAISARIIG